MRLLTVFFTIFFALSLFFAPAFSAQKNISPEMENRAHRLEGELRCVSCQGQSIADSDAPIAKDMKAHLRTRMAEGASDEDIVSELVKKYGDYVLFKPRFELKTLLLWGLPIMVIFGGGVIIALKLRLKKKEQLFEKKEIIANKQDGFIQGDASDCSPLLALTDEENKRIEALLAQSSK